MQRRISVVMTFGLVALATVAFAQQGGRSAAQPGQAQGEGRGAARAAPAVVPAMLFKEEWRRAPEALGDPTTERRNPANQYYLAGQSAVTNSNLVLTLYGTLARNITVYEHEGRFDLWTGLAGSPVAVTLKDRNRYVDLTGLARIRAILRTSSLHTLHPVMRLADGTLLVGSQRISTNAQFLSTEVAFGNQRWFRLDPMTVTTGSEVMTPDLARVDEVGFVDLTPGGGHGSAGWSNISTVELYAKAVPR